MEIQELLKVLSRNISQIRVAKGMSQKEVALGAGVDQGQYSRIENGKIDPALSTLQKLADAFDVPLTDFFKADAPEEMVFTDKLKAVMKMNKEDKQLVEKIIDMTLFTRKSLDNAEALNQKKSK
ncbi:MAG TPA: helix-turn-helix transcriptional regulator [Cyclobacteriaceae bacterium]|jgi:transcriptional regulator with XRE-family HTH domain|nr:helix-turn-helix transcriptional regulator [Cyclobacteriaceae bacterium]